MGILERRERQKAELREQILEASRAIVLAQGFGALSMRKIAEAIEYSPATIYLHFASRDQIALQLVREGFEQLLAAVAPARHVSDPLERLRDIGRRYVRFGLENPEAYRLIFMESPEFSSELFRAQLDAPEEPAGRAFAVLADTVRDLIERGVFRATLDVDVTAEVLWCGVHGIVSLRLACGSNAMTLANSECLTEEMFQMAARGLVAT